MSSTVIKVENLGKQYRLGKVGTGTISHDFNRWWHSVRGKEDPYLKIGEVNDRTKLGTGNLVWALKDINFEVKQGEVLGIIGKNGAGKSTLLKILSRVTAPTIGDIKVKGRIASLLEVGTGFHPELSGRENIYLNGAILGMTKKEINSKFDEIVDFSGVERYIDTPVKRYSSGMYVRLAFAVAAHLEPEILIVDEVLAVGDAEFQKKCLGKMKDVSGQGRTVLFVSHNMAAVKALCTQGILMDKGTVGFDGSINDTISKYLNTNLNKDDIYNISFTPNNKHLQVTQISIVDKNNLEFDRPINPMESFYIKINYHFRRLISKLHLTVVILNSEGIEVYFMDRRDISENFAYVEEGFYESIINIANPMLKPGKYYVTIGCADNDEGVNDHKFEVLSFTIEASGLFRTERPGFLYLPAEWELKKQNNYKI
jgi:lipopolysaccharide transport system ATP-binding protein